MGCGCSRFIQVRFISTFLIVESLSQVAYQQAKRGLTFVFASFTCFFKPSISFFASSADGLDLFFLALTGDSSIEISESKILTSGRFAFSPGAFCAAPLLLVFEAA
jgi:hypothetical protein